MQTRTLTLQDYGKKKPLAKARGNSRAIVLIYFSAFGAEFRQLFSAIRFQIVQAVLV